MKIDIPDKRGQIDLYAEEGTITCLQKTDRPEPFLAFSDLAKEAMKQGWQVASDTTVLCDITVIRQPYDDPPEASVRAY